MNYAKQSNRGALAAIAFILLLGISCIYACSPAWKAGKCKQWGICQEVKDSTVNTTTDSTYLTPIAVTNDPDSAWLIAYFECDSVNRVILRKMTTINGKVIQMQMDIENGAYTTTAYLPGKTDTLWVKSRLITKSFYRDRMQQSVKTDRHWTFYGFWIIAVLVALAAVVWIINRVKK